MPRKETERYAQARANETGRAYVVTTLGHAFMLAGNGALITACGGVFKTFRRISGGANGNA